MSRQLKKIHVFPVTDNLVKVITDQEDWVDEANVNKIITRTPDHYPLGVDTVHTNVKDGAGTILEVVSLDPLAVTTSGYSDKILDGYDGLVVSADGYIKARGSIRSYTDTTELLISPAYCSAEGNYWLLGGFDSSTDGYVNSVWHSFNGTVWEQLSEPPWSARGHAQAVTDGSSLWVLGGWDAKGTPTVSSPTEDIWKATINATSGALTWEGSAAATGVGLLSDYFKATLLPSIGYAYTGAGAIDLSDGTEYPHSYGEDGYSSVIHMDDIRHILSFSKDGRRDEYIIENDGNLLFDGVPEQGYVHHQAVGATTWNVTHGLNSTEVAPFCYTESREILEPLSCNWDDANSLTLDFNVAEAGRVIVTHAKYYSGTTWNLTDGYAAGASAWNIVDTDGELVDAIVTNATTLDFNENTDGYLAAWSAFDGVDALAGRRYISEFNAVAGNNSVAMYQTGDAHLTWLRGTTGDKHLTEPTSYDYSDDANAVVNFTVAQADVAWASMNMRHDGYRTLQEPWDGDYVNIGVNAKDLDTLYIIGSDGVWTSGDAGIHWSRQSAIGADVPVDRLVPVTCEESLVSTMTAALSISHSLDAGDNFEDTSGGISGQTIVWEGALGIPVDNTYQLFIYERPGDVIWESEYGHLPGEIDDDYSTHYVLPFPAVPVSANASAIEIAMPAVYGRSVIEDEFTDDWVYLMTAATGAVVDRKLISRNTAAAAGSNFTFFCKALSVTPTAAHVVQIIKSRPEGANYYKALTRNTALKHTLYHESDGSAFIKDQERRYDFYAHMKSKGGLPEHIQSEANEQRINSLHVELNRQRVAGAKFYNDASSLVPELLESLGSQLGLRVDESLDLQTQRHAIPLWFSQIDAYGGCLDGVTNMISLILGTDSGVVATMSDPNGDAMSGRVLNVSLSTYADFSWDYASGTNTVAYDKTENRWGMVVDVADVSSTLKTLIHSSMVHYRDSVTDGPLLITNHGFNSGAGEVTIWFDTPEVAELGYINGTSVIALYSEPKQRKLFKFIKLLTELVPAWVTVKVS